MAQMTKGIISIHPLKLVSGVYGKYNKCMQQFFALVADITCLLTDLNCSNTRGDFISILHNVSCWTQSQISLTLTSPRDWRLFTAPTIFWWSIFSSLATSMVSIWSLSAINCSNLSPSSAMIVVFGCAFKHSSRTDNLVHVPKHETISQCYPPIRRQADRRTQRPPEAVSPLTVYGRFFLHRNNTWQKPWNGKPADWWIALSQAKAWNWTSMNTYHTIYRIMSQWTIGSNYNSTNKVFKGCRG